MIAFVSMLEDTEMDGVMVLLEERSQKYSCQNWRNNNDIEATKFKRKIL